MERRLGLAVLVLIVVQAVSWPLAMLTAPVSGVRWLPAAVAAYGLATLTAIGTALFSLRGRPLGQLAFAPAIAGVAFLALGGLQTEAGYGTGYSHPTLAVSIGLALLLALEMDFARTAFVAAGLAVAYLLGVTSTLALGASVLTSAASNVATLVAVPVVGGWLGRTFVELARSRAAYDTTSAQVRRGEAREEERSRQYRLLHDTVLSTLSALSRGSLDTMDPAVSQRLSADADYLRGLIATSASGAGMHLVGELSRMTREQAVTGLRVHQHISDVPDELPHEVKRALTDSIYEALTNVVKHSGRREAWVTIVGAPQGEGVTVTITDQGAGFDPAARRAGRGIDHSLRARMADVGGSASIDSEPGQGTTVELRWPA
ncbi:MAG: ATP-binding protein [Tetrasphaera sp.]